jgi:hypothetical protein
MNQKIIKEMAMKIWKLEKEGNETELTKLMTAMDMPTLLEVIAFLEKNFN